MRLTTDNPQRVGEPEELIERPDEYELADRKIKDEAEYSLIDDCKSIMALGAEMEAFAARPVQKDIFTLARERNTYDAAMALVHKTAKALPRCAYFNADANRDFEEGR